MEQSGTSPTPTPGPRATNLLGHLFYFSLSLSPQNVTKGARTKIILSIRKLARRPETLQEIEQVKSTILTKP
jgi:hypothetical protein